MNIQLYMKPLLLVLVAVYLPIAAHSQLAAFPTKGKKKTIPVSTDQKITLIFPDQVTEAVLGNTRINLNKSNNKCFLNAVDTRGFNATSLFVSLANGDYFDLLLKYKPVLDTTVFVFSENEVDGVDSYVKKAAEEQKGKVAVAAPIEVPFKLAEEFINNSNLVLEKPVFITDKGAIGQNLVFFLQSIYHENNKTYVRIAAKNFSNVAYDIRDIRFTLVPTKGFLNTLAGEHKQVKPVFVLNGHKNTIDPKTTVSKVFVFDKFELSDKKQFYIDIFEGNSKQLQFALTKADMEKAVALSKN